MGASRSGWPYREIASLAGRQETMITHAQLIDLGVAAGSVASAVGLGRLYRVHQGVYSIVPPAARPRLAAEHAAILACGPAAVVSHWSAAWLHGLSERRPKSVQITVVGERGRRRRGLDVHRTSVLARPDRTRAGGLPATTVVRTLIDLSPALADRQLEPLLDRALRTASHAAVRSALQRAKGRPGTERVRALLDPNRPSADAWSAAERRLLELIRASGLPQPECDVPLGDHRRVPDLLWRAARVIVEYES